jgi:transposase-like protein
MRLDLTVESVAKDFAKWRSQRVGNQRMPEDLLRAAALLSEQTSVAEVAKQLNINHTRLSQAVLLLQNERMSISASSEQLSTKRELPARALTFTKVEAIEKTGEQSVRLPEQQVYAQFFLPSGVRCEVTSLRAFRAFCKTLL